jgi:hypothetical protein
MLTYSTSTEAFTALLGRNRNRYEVEHGVTIDKVEGETVITSQFAKYSAHNNFSQGFNDDFTVWTKTGPACDRLVNNYLLDIPFTLIAGGDFVGEEEKMVKRKIVSGWMTRLEKVIVKRNVAILGDFIIKSVEPTENGNVVITAVKL